MLLRNHRKLVYAISLLFASVSLYYLSAQSGTGAPVVPPIQKVSDLAQAPNEIAVLKAQLATMQIFTDRLISTVYWALGSLVVIGSLLIGFSWFNGMRLHDRDIMVIRNELTSSLRADFLKFQQELELSTNAKLNEIISSSQSNATNAAESLLKPIQGSIQVHASAIKELQKDLAYITFKAEAWYWEVKNVPTNVFTQYVEILRLAIKEKDSFEISDNLQKLRELIIPGIHLMAVDITDLVGLIDKLPTEYVIHVEALRSKLRTVEPY